LCLQLSEAGRNLFRPWVGSGRDKRPSWTRYVGWAGADCWYRAADLNAASNERTARMSAANENAAHIRAAYIRTARMNTAYIGAARVRAAWEHAARIGAAWVRTAWKDAAGMSRACDRAAADA
jgi:hypothetical protein